MTRLISLSVLLLSFFVVVADQALFAQSDPGLGVLPFSAHVGGQYDSIDPATGNVMLKIPILSKAGKIPFSFSLVGNFHKYALTYSGQTFWIGPNPATSHQNIKGVASGLATVLAYTMTSSLCNGSYSQWTYANFVLTDETGAAHSFGYVCWFPKRPMWQFRWIGTCL